MLDFPRWKTIGISIILLLGIVFTVPSFLPEKTTAQLPGLLQSRVNLGLDLAGGSHLLLEADLSDFDAVQLEKMERSVRQAMRGDPGPDDDVAIGELTRGNGQISFMVRELTQLDEARERVNRLTQGVAQGTQLTAQRDWEVSFVDTTRVVLKATQAGRDAEIANAMDSARDIVDRRVNALGTREPTIIREGNDRIVVQVPGLEDPQQLKDLLGQTARLEFRMVDETANPADAAAGRAPVGSELVPYAASSGQEGGFEVALREDLAFLRQPTPRIQRA